MAVETGGISMGQTVVDSMGFYRRETQCFDIDSDRCSGFPYVSLGFWGWKRISWICWTVLWKENKKEVGYNESKNNGISAVSGSDGLYQRSGDRGSDPSPAGVYLDSIGTILVGIWMGPVFGGTQSCQRDWD